MPSGGGSKTQTVTSDVPAEYKQFGQENLTIAGTIANMPHVQYQGPRIAGMNDTQQKAIAGVKGSDFGTGAMKDLTGFSAQTGAQNMDAYFNPYEDRVVEGMQTQAQKGLMKGLNTLGARAAGGNFGSRLGVSEGVATAEATDNLSRNVSNLLHTGFTTAAGLGAQDADRDLSGAGLRLNAANSLAQAEAAKAAALMGMGDREQAQEQGSLDLAYGDFLDQQNAPLRALSIRQAALGQTPMGSVQRVPVQGGGGFGSALSGIGGLMGGLGAMGICWVARAAYGEDNPKWLRFRSWMLHDAPNALFHFYIKHGPSIAEWVSDKPWAKAALRGAMNTIIWQREARA